MGNKTLLLWGIVITLLLGIILVIGNMQKSKELKLLEKQLKEITKEYLKDTDSFPEGYEIVKVSVETLKDEEYIDDLELVLKYCITEVHVKKELLLYEYTYNIECVNTN